MSKNILNRDTRNAIRRNATAEAKYHTSTVELAGHMVCLYRDAKAWGKGVPKAVSGGIRAEVLEILKSTDRYPTERQLTTARDNVVKLGKQAGKLAETLEGMTPAEVSEYLTANGATTYDKILRFYAGQDVEPDPKAPKKRTDSQLADDAIKLIGRIQDTDQLDRVMEVLKLRVK